MKKTSKTIVFFGSGPVAAESLTLLKKNFNIEAVITKPRALHHKGSVPVIEVAQNTQTPIFTVSSRDELDELINNTSFSSQVAVLIDFGIIVSKNTIDYFPLGIINSHFSLLPHLRGADPISFAILNGDKKTGVSLMLVDEGMDTGKLITQKVLSISNDSTTPALTYELIQLSNQLLNNYLPRYIDGEIKPKNQPHPDRATYTRKLQKSDGVLDWHKPADVLEREIRAYIGWPGSRMTLFGKDAIITKAHQAIEQNNLNPLGAVWFDKTSGVINLQTTNGVLSVERLKPAGKKEMASTAFMQGIKQ